MRQGKGTRGGKDARKPGEACYRMQEGRYALRKLSSIDTSNRLV